MQRKWPRTVSPLPAVAWVFLCTGGWSVTTSRSTLQLSAQWVRLLFTDLLPVNEVYCLTIPVEWLNAAKQLHLCLGLWPIWLLVSMTQSMRCHNLDNYIVVHSEEHFPNSWQIEGNHKKGLMSFYTQSSVLPLFLVWIPLLVCPPIRMLQLNSLKCSSRKLLTNGYTYSPTCSPYAKPISTRFF